MVNNDDLSIHGTIKKLQLIYIFEKNELSDLSMVSVFSNITKLNDKAPMMGYGNISLYHKYVYNKIKYFC